jgi:hypothetical protein
MALIVEDGTVVAGANSYCTKAYADNYHANVGNVAWAALPSVNDVPAPAESVVTKEALLQRATQYMLGVYRLRWLGLRISPTQSLDWPRLGVILKDTASFFVDQRLAYTVPANIVPDVVQQACSELALRASTQDLWPDLDQRTLLEKVGPIQVNYDRFSPQYRRFRQVDLLLNPYLDGTNGLTTRVVRR